jgi:hypothetical protein
MVRVILIAVFAMAIMLLCPNITQFGISDTSNSLFGGNNLSLSPSTTNQQASSIQNQGTFNLFTNTRYGFRIQYPSNWTYFPLPVPSLVNRFVFTAPAGGLYGSFTIKVDNASKILDPNDLQVKTITAENYSRRRVVNITRSDLMNENIVYNYPTTIAGQPAWILSYISNSGGRQVLYSEQTFIVKNDNIYELEFMADPLDVPYLRPLAQKFLQSFQFIEVPYNSQSSNGIQAQAPPSPSSSTITTTQGVAAQGQPLQQIPSTPDSFKNNDNKTLQVISVNVVSIPGSIRQSMTGQVKNTGNDTLRSLTITAQVLDSKYKIIGTVIAIAENTNLAPGQQTSLSGLGSVSWGTKPVYYKLTFDWL